MENFFKILSSLLLITNVVFAVETEEVSVMEGDFVTLHTGVEKQKNDLIVWYFGPEKTLVAQINGKAESSKIDGLFLGRVQVDNQTGSLNITNINTTDSGLYTLRISSRNKVSYKTFSVTVYDRLPIPIIQCSSSSESSSVSRCSLLCSVFNVSHVTLSWLKGHSLLSSISVSDLSISVSLPLELEYKDKNSYSCVVNNIIRNQTKHLDISDLCTNSSFEPTCLPALISALVFFLTIIALVVGICIRKQKGGYRKANLVKTVSDETSIKIKENKIFTNKSEDGNASLCYPHV